MTAYIWIDGSCLDNPGPGGCAWIIRRQEGTVQRGRAGYKLTTNNRMEIMAAIQAVRRCHAEDAVIHTDSRYLSDAFNKNWLAKWLQRSGFKASGQKVANWDLWLALWEEMGRRLNTWKWMWIWVRGHDGCYENEDCDRRAREAAERPTRKDAGYANAKGS